MLLTHDEVKEFTRKPIADVQKMTELPTAPSIESGFTHVLKMCRLYMTWLV